MGLLTDLIPGVTEIKMIIALACVGGLVGGGFYIKHEWDYFQELKTDNATLTQNNKVLQENVDVANSNTNKCIADNVTQNATIAGLEKERADAQAAVTNLAAQQKSNTLVISTLQSHLTLLEKVAANDGTLSVDLKETIRGIEGGAPK